MGAAGALGDAASVADAALVALDAAGWAAARLGEAGTRVGVAAGA